jgi:heptosyltransferase-2
VTPSPKLLVVGPSWVGDMVMAQALYRQLAQRSPRPEIHVLAPAWSLPLLERMPEVSRAIELPAGHGELALRKRYRLGRSLRSADYAQAIVLPRSWKSALVPYFARARRRTGYRGEWRYGLINDMRRFDPARLDQTVKRFGTLGTPVDGSAPPAIEAPRLRVQPDNLARLERSLALGSRAGSPIALLPGAEYGPAKRWPVGHFAALAERLAQSGRQVWVLGSAKETALGEQIAARKPHSIVNLCGRTSLADAVDLLSACPVAVSNDSGLLHIAAAVGCYVVALYGSSSPDFTPPLTRRKRIFHLGLECSPCHQRSCPLQHLRCLNEISVDEVLAAVDLAGTETAAPAGAGLRQT